MLKSIYIITNCILHVLPKFQKIIFIATRIILHYAICYFGSYHILISSTWHTPPPCRRQVNPICTRILHLPTTAIRSRISFDEMMISFFHLSFASLAVSELEILPLRFNDDSSRYPPESEKRWHHIKQHKNRVKNAASHIHSTVIFPF